MPMASERIYIIYYINRDRTGKEVLLKDAKSLRAIETGYLKTQPSRDTEIIQMVKLLENITVGFKI